jgi:hypothetical protein
MDKFPSCNTATLHSATVPQPFCAQIINQVNHTLTESLASLPPTSSYHLVNWTTSNEVAFMFGASLKNATNFLFLFVSHGQPFFAMVIYGRLIVASRVDLDSFQLDPFL